MPRLVPLILILCIAVAAAVLLVPATLPSGGAGGGFDRKVRAYLMAHPEVIMEAVATLERRNSAVRAEGQREAIRAHRAVLEESPFLPVAGNPEGDVTVVEFFDYQCPYCKRALPELRALVAGDGKVRVVFREFPVLGPDSVLAARAAVAAVFQGKYLPFHEALMAHEGRLDAETVMAVAEKAGLDRDRLRADMEKPEVADAIGKSHGLARRLGINATPTFVVGDTLVPGYVDAATLRGLVAKARQAR